MYFIVTYPKGDIILEEGQSLEIFCHLNEDYVEKYDDDSSKHITFYKDNSRIPEETVEIVNKSTIRLFVEKTNASKHFYYCRENNEMNVCLNYVIVGSKYLCMT